MNSYRRGLRNDVLVSLKLFILEKVNFDPHIKCWSNLVKLSQTWSNVLQLVLFGAGHYRLRDCLVIGTTLFKVETNHVWSLFLDLKN